MTHYATCRNCAVDATACERRAGLRAALKGHGVRSLKFTCADRRPLFVPGQRVQFDWILWDNDDYESVSIPLNFHGTALRESGTKFVVQVDPGVDASGEGINASEVFRRSDQLLVKVKPSDMRSVNEPNRAVCLTCFRVEGVADDRCYRMTDWTPDGCQMPSDAVLAAREPVSP